MLYQVKRLLDWNKVNIIRVKRADIWRNFLILQPTDVHSFKFLKNTSVNNSPVIKNTDLKVSSKAVLQLVVKYIKKKATSDEPIPTSDQAQPILTLDNNKQIIMILLDEQRQIVCAHSSLVLILAI